jgi:hypothetical protein
MRTSKKATMLLISSLVVGIGAPAWRALPSRRPR